MDLMSFRLKRKKMIWIISSPKYDIGVCTHGMGTLHISGGTINTERYILVLEVLYLIEQDLLRVFLEIVLSPILLSSKEIFCVHTGF